jgi:hypothetical protein
VLSLLQYMDRTFVVQQGRTPVFQLGLELWTKHVLHHPVIKERLRALLLEQINRERGGELIDRGVIRSTTKVTRGDTGVWVCVGVWVCGCGMGGWWVLRCMCEGWPWPQNGCVWGEHPPPVLCMIMCQYGDDYDVGPLLTLATGLIPSRCLLRLWFTPRRP